MPTTLVKNGTVVTAGDRYDADVLIEDGRITTIGQGLKTPADTVVDARGKLVMPGGIDVHTHLDMPFGGTTSADDFESGTVAAAHGGTTTIVDFAIQSYGEGLYPAFEGWMKKAEGRSVIDYAFHMIVRELTDQVSIEMDRMVKNEGVTSFKLFMAYPGVFMVDDATIFKAMLKTRENGGLICMHAENGGVIDTLVKEALRKGQTAPKYHALTRPTRAEGEATGRAIALAEMAGVPLYIVHLSCADALEKVKQARDMGLPAYAETCPQYLFLSYEDYERPGFEGAKFVMSPPLREKWNQVALWKGLAGNDLQVVSTDHCPFCMNEKKLGEGDFSKIPNGAPGHRDAPDAAVGRRRAHQPHRRPPVRRDRLHQPRQDVRAVAAEGHGGGGIGRRPHRLRSRARDDPLREDAPHEGRLQPLRGAEGHRRAGDGPLPRRGDRRRRQVRGQEGPRPVREARGRRAAGAVSVATQVEHPDGRVEIVDTRPHRAEPALQRGPGAGAGGAAQLDDLQLRRAVDQHGALHPDLHAGVGADDDGHELVAGAVHDPARQHDRARSRSC